MKSEKRTIGKGDRLSFSGAYWSVVMNGGHLLKRREGEENRGRL